MAGHSKWANIKHRKAAQDAKRAKVFTRFIRDIITAARQGGGDITGNPALALVVKKAKSVNMTNEAIDRAIKRGTGEVQGADFIERTYEGYGPGGVAIIARTLTDNPTRTITNVRTAFSKNGGNVGTDGSVAWMFKECGQILYPSTIGDEDTIMAAAIEAGADDVEITPEEYRILTDVADFGSVRDTLEATFGDAETADLTFIPTQPQPVTDAETAQKIIKLISMLEDDADVQDVMTNADMPEEFIQEN